MTYITVTLALVLILYLFSVDWRELGRTLKQGGWFFIVVYALMGITIVKLIREGIGH